jgi:hypothetical protein
MVPVIDYSEELSKVLNYNEEKVQRGVAELLHAENFLQPTEKLNFYDKLQRFENLNRLNDTVALNTLHVSLNFHPADHPSKETLCEIAALYMDRIGMAGQPYLVYEHSDAGHPHVHIVSSLVRANGIRVKTHNMGKIQSVNARKEIDLKFGLKRVEDSQHTKIYEPDPINAQKVIYGKQPTKKALKDVIRFVLKKYKFSSLPELNAVLQQYNVLADRGTLASRIYKSGGLVYRILSNGKPVGVPIKASDFHFKPTLKALNPIFYTNHESRKQYLPDIKSRITWVMNKNPKTFDTWLANLRNERIQVVMRRNQNGIIYGLTYVDFKTKTVVNGADLGKAYTANSIVHALTGEKGSSVFSPTISEEQQEISRTSQVWRKIPRKKGVAGPEGSSSPKPNSHKVSKERSTSNRPPFKERRPDSSGQTISNGLLPPNISDSRQQGGKLLQDLLSELPQNEIPYELTVEPKKKRKRKLNR